MHSEQNAIISANRRDMIGSTLYLVGINKSKVRHLTCDALAETVGVYPEIIAENLSIFEAMLLMDMSTDLRELVPALEKYIAELEYLFSTLTNKKNIIGEDLQKQSLI